MAQKMTVYSEDWPDRPTRDEYKGTGLRADPDGTKTPVVVMKKTFDGRSTNYMMDAAQIAEQAENEENPNRAQYQKAVKALEESTQTGKFTFADPLMDARNAPASPAAVTTQKPATPAPSLPSPGA